MATPESVHDDAVAALRRVAAYQSGNPVLVASLQAPPSLMVFAGLTAILFGALYAISELSNYQEIRANWPAYRCHPSVTPFAEFYGFDLKETIRFCVGQSVKEFAPGVIDPLFKAINETTHVAEQTFDKVEVIAGGVESLLSKFKQFVVDFMNSFRLVGVQVRTSVVRIRDIFQRINGMFTAFAYAAISALTFGENIVCNPLVTFIADIAGTDICCFAPETLIPLADGTHVPICDIRIGDRFRSHGMVTSIFQFDGTDVEMVRIHGVHVSSNHAVWAEEHEKWIPAGKHPLAVRAPSISRLWCLNTTTNEIPVMSSIGPLLFTDYEESSDPDVVAAAQRLSEEAVNGWTWQAGPTVADYSLGLDPTFNLLLANGQRIPLADVAIGDILSTGARVEGRVIEQCANQCSVSGHVMSAAQLVFWNNRWDRAERIWPSRPADTQLIQLMTGGKPFVVAAADGSLFPVRDYVEWAGAQTVYDNALGV